ncbi:sugar ABC transporter permease [Caldalkalibacillus thermarum TA2.A1]|uniref:Sugar ABC transporter permease n=1 Tax=Caldalkalibacillus thermarum (strain TA2.A1) TaxID=986075 RepID=A0A8X8IAF9_CALTT|nr:sugar ABC transporter permease [Caldalkalibacillus thermarum]QZT33815.1 sugar ABC transporter permease [Caldalkalibacillus thermarum TA2.A1]
MSFIRRYWLEIIMVLPLVLYIFGFALVPVLETIRLSFYNPALGTYDFSNYSYILGQRNFKGAVFNTLTVTILGLALQLVIALTIALLLKRAFRGRGFFRTIMLIPMGVPTIVSGVIMLYIFSSNGYLNVFLRQIGLIDQPIIWNAGGWITVFAVIFADMWKVLPIMVLLLLAGLESIPEEVYEASAIDGATAWQNFWYVTLPLLKPSITMALILRAVDAFRIFELPLVLAGRNFPVIATYAYSEFRDYSNPYTSGAAATILLGIIILCILLYIFLVERKDNVQRA